MKYTDRKTTPLKWNFVVKFIVCPLLALSTIYSFLAMTNELIFNNKFSALKPVFGPYLNQFGVTLDNLGKMFWPVVAFYFLSMFLMAYFTYMMIGFFRWKESARKMWLLHLTVNGLLSAAGSAGVVMVLKDKEVVAMMKMMFSMYDNINLDLVITIVTVIMIGLAIIEVIIVIMNFIYYGKRKPLFSNHYASETEVYEVMKPIQETIVPEVVESESVEVVETTPVVNKKPMFGSISLDEPVTSDDQAVLTDFTQPLPLISDETEKEEVNELPQPVIEEAPVEEVADLPEPVVEEDVTEVISIPASVIEDDNDVRTVPETAVEEVLKFCPECGAELHEEDALFCSRCGTRLR